jgi:Uma2 family endonuclease
VQHARAHRLGEVWTEVGFRLFSDPDTVRAPDVAFVSADRLPAREATGFYRGAPDVAFDVLSPDDTPSESDRVDDHLRAGMLMVVVVNPALEQITVHQPGELAQPLEGGDTLDLEAVITGLRLDLSALFE